MLFDGRNNKRSCVLILPAAQSPEELSLAVCLCWQVACKALVLLAEVTSTVATKTGAEFTVQKSIFITVIMQINTNIVFPNLYHAQST